PGIEDSEKALVMERFKRGKASNGVVGSGLGLSIVSRVAETHGGQVALKDREGGGLTVAVSLPLPRRGGGGFAMIAALVVSAALLMPPGPAEAAPLHYPAPDGSTNRTITIVGTTDTPLFSHFIDAFQTERPDVSVVYEESDSRPIYERFVDGDL